MEKYLIEIEGANGEPNGDYHYNIKCNSDNIKEKLYEELSEKYDDEIPEDVKAEHNVTTIDELVNVIIDEKYFHTENWGYGIKYTLEITKL